MIRDNRAISQSVTAVVLSGGLGTRLRTVLPNTQKTIASVAGRPFIEKIFAQLEASGIEKVVLCVGYLAEQVQAQIGDTFGSLKIYYSIERALLGTAGAIRFALDQVHTKTLLVMNGDSFCDVDIAEFIEFHHSLGGSASMVVTNVPNTKRYGRVNVGADDRIESFDEKGSVEGPGYINAGIYLFDRKVIEELAPGKNLSLERDVFPKLTERDLCGFEADTNLFIDIGTPESLQEAGRIFEGSCPCGDGGCK